MISRCMTKFLVYASTVLAYIYLYIFQFIAAPIDLLAFCILYIAAATYVITHTYVQHTRIFFHNFNIHLFHFLSSTYTHTYIYVHTFISHFISNSMAFHSPLSWAVSKEDDSVCFNLPKVPPVSGWFCVDGVSSVATICKKGEQKWANE